MRQFAFASREENFQLLKQVRLSIGALGEPTLPKSAHYRDWH